MIPLLGVGFFFFRLGANAFGKVIETLPDICRVKDDVPLVVFAGCDQVFGGYFRIAEKLAAAIGKP